MSMGRCLLLLRFSMKRVSILDQDSLSPATCVSTLVVKFVVVGGERNPASLAPSFRVRGRLEWNPASLEPGRTVLIEHSLVTGVSLTHTHILPLPFSVGSITFTLTNLWLS